LVGVAYHFKGNVPRLRSNYVGDSEISEFSKSDRTLGLIVGPLSADNAYSNGHTLFSPPIGKTIWENCSKQGRVALDPGSHKVYTDKFAYSGSVKYFFARLAHRGGNIPTLGASVLIALEPQLRTTLDEKVKLAYNMDVRTTSSLKFVKKLVIPQRNNSATLSFA
jgi:hypothetical protein